MPTRSTALPMWPTGVPCRALNHPLNPPLGRPLHRVLSQVLPAVLRFALRLLLCGALILPTRQAAANASMDAPQPATASPTAPGRVLPPYLWVAGLQPNINITPEQLAIAARRSHLHPAAKLECSALDTRLPTLERAAKRAKPDTKAEAEQALAQARQRYAALRC